MKAKRLEVGLSNAIPSLVETGDERGIAPGDGFKLRHGMWAKPSSFVRRSGGEELGATVAGKVEVG